MSRRYILEARDNLAELIRRNFTAGDVVVHLTYIPDDDPDGNISQAENDLCEYIRYLETLWRQTAGDQAHDFRYIGITGTERRGHYGESFHHYVLLPGSLNAADLCTGWKKGHETQTSLFDAKGKTGIVNRVTNKRQTSGTWRFARCLEQVFDERDLMDENEEKIFLLPVDTDSGCLGVFDMDDLLCDF